MYSSFPIRDDKFEESDLQRKFVCFLNSLRQKDIQAYVDLLNRICFPSKTGVFNSKDAPLIQSPYPIGNGKEIDVLVRSSDTLCALELKYWSQPGKTQASDYKGFLKGLSEATKTLIFLLPIKVGNDCNIDDYITWAQIMGFLRVVKTSNKDSQGLVSDFGKLLEKVGLDDRKPDSRIIEIIQEATKLVFDDVNKNPLACGGYKYAGYTGFYIRDEFPKEFWCGITHNFPSLIRFNTEEGAKYKYSYADETRDLIKTNLPCFKKNYFITKFGPQMDIPKKWGHISFLFHMDQRFCSLSHNARKGEINKFIKCASEAMDEFR